jgi:hypothetical protein
MARNSYMAEIIGKHMPRLLHGLPCLVLLLSTLLNLKSRQVDYSQAFPQADLHDQCIHATTQGWFYNMAMNNITPHQDLKFHDTSHYNKFRKKS